MLCLIYKLSQGGLISEFMLDTANIADIKKFADMLPLAGVTSNTSIGRRKEKLISSNI